VVLISRRRSRNLSAPVALSRQLPHFWKEAPAPNLPDKRTAGGGFWNGGQLLLAKFAEASKDYKRFDLDIDAGLRSFYLDGLPWSTKNFLARTKVAKNVCETAQTELGQLPDLERKMNEVAVHATAHAASCLSCQQEVRNSEAGLEPLLKGSERRGNFGHGYQCRRDGWPARWPSGLEVVSMAVEVQDGGSHPRGLPSQLRGKVRKSEAPAGRRQVRGNDLSGADRRGLSL
jgi:hypothetical protein